MKSLQAFTDMSLRVMHIIDVNLETMDLLARKLQELQSQKALRQPKHVQIASLLCSLSKIGSEHRFIRKNFESMVRRAKSLSNQASVPQTCSEDSL